MKKAELNTKQVNFELDEDEIEMVSELIRLESAKKGKLAKARFMGGMIREKHCTAFPSKWDDEGNYIPRLEKLHKQFSISA